ncbi:hypothetical protein Syun_009376 [Stephania yunnanensis]|uniref:Uncharacterized protein n=1 Tax=Stephania yunnanensis TaxID=152371 RepID=A0AAP0KGV2_9MAGN
MAAAAALSKIETAHQMYRDGRHEEALRFYTDALAIAKTKPQKIALHSNRAACYLKLHDFTKAAEECTSVLELDHKHTGALMLRAQTLVTLREYQSALFDVNRLLELNPSSEVYQNLRARLKAQLEKGHPVVSLTAKDLKIDKNVHSEPDTLVPESKDSQDVQSKGWEAIPKPKGHSNLDYSRWDRVEDHSSEDEEEEDQDSQPQFRFRVRTVGDSVHIPTHLRNQVLVYNHPSLESGSCAFVSSWKPVQQKLYNLVSELQGIPLVSPSMRWSSCLSFPYEEK